MSHTALRRVVIRLLHDPALARALAADPSRALAGVDLTADKVGALAAVPASAWRTDPDRPQRVLAALGDEFPAAVRLAPARTARFFASIHFHRAVQERGSLALALGAHLAEDDDPRVVAVARLETAIARVRRAPRAPAPSPPDRLRLAPSAEVADVLEGTTALLEALRSGAPPGGLGRVTVPVLVVRDPQSGEVTIEDLDETLATLLRRARCAIRRDDLIAGARALGAATGDADAALVDLVGAGVLV